MPGTPDLAWRKAVCSRHGGEAREADGVYVGSRFTCGACWRASMRLRNLKHRHKPAGTRRADAADVAANVA
jgi:hypothetical protein